MKEKTSPTGRLRQYGKLVGTRLRNDKPRQLLPAAIVFLGFGLIGLHIISSHAATSGLPAGVTLQQIDGGSNYYCSNGFTNACSASSVTGGMSWDDPKFFPICDDYAFYGGNSTATFKNMNMNCDIRDTAGTDMSVLRNAGIYVIQGAGDNPPNMGTETVGWHVEEPGSWSDVTSQVAESDSVGLQGRFIHLSGTWNQFVYGGWSTDPCGSSMPAAMSCPISTSIGTRHLNLPSDDIYWFAGSTQSNTYGAIYAGSLFYNNGGTGGACGDAGSGIKCMTPDQMARGSNYGDMVDKMREWMAPPAQSAPICAPYIETEDGLAGAGAREITPPEFNWAAWQTIVHGARCMMYFGTTSNFGSTGTFGFSQTVLSGQSVSMYNQAIATNTKIKDLAPIINSPFALHYASVTPSAYVFPTEHAALDSGIDIMSKYYTGGSYTNSTGTMGNGFYIFSSVRGSETQTNINATFTTADNYTGPVTVVGENRTVQATNGVFNDTFANATTVHIYQIPYSNSTPTVQLTANPTTIPGGSSSQLSWISLKTSSCTASGGTGFSGSVATSGNVTVTPSSTTTYTLSCTGSGGTAQATATLTVGPTLLVGNQSLGVSDTDGPGTADAFKYTAAATGTASTMSFYADNGTAATSLKLGIYSDNNGVPGTLLASGATSSITSGAWNTVTLSPGTNITAGTVYWLAFLGTGGNVGNLDQQGTGCSQTEANTNLSALPATWVAGTSWPSCQSSMYVSAAASQSSGKVGDLNNDNSVNITDLSILLSAWGTTNSAITTNLGTTGTINITDLSIFLSHWGT